MRRGRWLVLSAVMASFLATAAAAIEPDPASPGIARGNVWYLRNTLTTGDGDTTFSYGRAGDTQLMGDWDGDGIDTPAVVRGNTWFLRSHDRTGVADVVFRYGVVEWDRDPRYQPVVGDWDGDGTDTPGWFQRIDKCLVIDYPDRSESRCEPDSSRWSLRNRHSTGTADVDFDLDAGGLHPVVGTWVGGDRDHVGVVHGNLWQLDRDLDDDVEAMFRYGTAGDVPVVGDWDGDAEDDPISVRGNVWLLRQSTTTGDADTSFQYGKEGDRFFTW